MDAAIFPIITCPVSHQPLSIAPQEVLTQINSLIMAGSFTNRGNQVLSNPITTGLIRADGRVIYPIRNDIALLLATEAIDVPLGY